MRIIFLMFVLLFSSSVFAGSELEVNKVKLPDAISLVYSEVLKVPFMFNPQLVNDERMITFRLTPDIDKREFITRYLGNINIRIYTKQGVDYIAPFTPKEPVKPRYTWTYTPQYRSVSYLSDVLSGYVSGSFNNSGAVISESTLKGSSGANNYINRSGDILVYYGTKDDNSATAIQLRRLLNQVMHGHDADGIAFPVSKKRKLRQRNQCWISEQCRKAILKIYH